MMTSPLQDDKLLRDWAFEVTREDAPPTPPHQEDEARVKIAAFRSVIALARIISDIERTAWSYYDPGHEHRRQLLTIAQQLRELTQPVAPPQDDPRIAAIRQRLAKATPGPWQAGHDGNIRVYGPDGRGEDSGLIANVFKGRVNAEFIAHAPEDIHYLLDALTAATQEK